MRGFNGLAANLATVMMTLQLAVYGSTSGLAKRKVELGAMTGYKGAVLLINQVQTSCEAALVDSSAAFVAASCLKYTNGKVDTSATYELVIKMGSGSDNSQKHTITKIDVHSGYDSSTFINNLAVIQFNTGSAIAWQNYIGINPNEWDNEYFVRRTLTESASTTWNNIIAFSTMDTPGDCSKASKVYSANKGDFLCNYAATLSIYNRDCKVPYGTVYGVVQPDDFGIVALHSHTAIYGDSMCSTQKKLHYYTLLRNYIAWAARILGRSVGGFTKDTDFKLTLDYSYSMKSVSDTSVSGVKVFSGNRYAQDPIDPALADPDRPPATNTSTNQAASAAGSQSGSNNTPALDAGVSSDNAANGSKTASSANAAISSPSPSPQSPPASSNNNNDSDKNGGNSTGSPGNDEKNNGGDSESKADSNSSDAPNSGSEENNSDGDSSISSDGGSSSINKDNDDSKDNGDDGQQVVLTEGAASNTDSDTNAMDTNGNNDNENVINIGPSETGNVALGSPGPSPSTLGSSSKTEENNGASKSSTTKVVVIIVIILLIIAAAGGGWYLWKRKKRMSELEHQSVIEKNGWATNRSSLASNYLRPPNNNLDENMRFIDNNGNLDRGSRISNFSNNYYGNSAYNNNRVDDSNMYQMQNMNNRGLDARGTTYTEFDDHYIHNPNSYTVNNNRHYSGYNTNFRPNASGHESRDFHGNL